MFDVFYDTALIVSHNSHIVHYVVNDLISNMLAWEKNSVSVKFLCIYIYYIVSITMIRATLAHNVGLHV